jgi:hypothetical protein
MTIFRSKLSPDGAITSLADRGDHPSWPGEVAAAKPQTGWWAKTLRKFHDIDINSFVEPLPRRFAPPLLARRVDRSDLPGILLLPSGRGSQETAGEGYH